MSETVRTATLEEDDNGSLTGSAIIVFQKPPTDSNELTDGNHTIDGKKVHIVFIRNEVSETHQGAAMGVSPFVLNGLVVRTPKNFMLLPRSFSMVLSARERTS